MKTWVDVNEGDWFYNEVMEASNYLMEDGSTLVSGIPYNMFQAGSPYLYAEMTGHKGQYKYTIDETFTPTPSNPLFVYIDGIQTTYKTVAENGVDPLKTDVTLHYSPPEGGLLSFAMFGKPTVDTFGKPSVGAGGLYPKKILQYFDIYYYEPFSRAHQEYLWAFGRQVKRYNVPDAEWGDFTDEQLATKYIGFNADIYIVNPNTGTVILPYNLNGVTCKFTYWTNEDGVIRMRGGSFRTTSESIKHVNRFFPNALITRAEAFTLIDKMRKSFYSRFTDLDAPSGDINMSVIAYPGQKVFKLNSGYPRFVDTGEQSLNLTHTNGNGVTVPLVRVTDYDEFDSNTILMKKTMAGGDIVTFMYDQTESMRFMDIGKDAGYYIESTDTRVLWDETAWFNGFILSMENETFNDGTFLMSGFLVTNFDEGEVVVDTWLRPSGSDNTVTPQRWFMPHSPLTRAEAVTFLNSFRQWCIQRFK